MKNQLKTEIETVVGTSKDLNMRKLHSKAWPLIKEHHRIANYIGEIEKTVGTKNYNKLANSILRSAFLIELVKVPKIETTKFRERWFHQLDGDPRWCSFEECLEIAADLLEQLIAWMSDENHAKVLELAFECSLLPYEIPVDYICRITENGRLHERGNVVWYYDELVLRTLKLRKYLTTSEQSPDVDFFKQVLTEKIKVKTYLTDRVLTGDHKTNREKRWETHPKSVHFAERRTCMAIEYALVTKICSFEGFPERFLNQLQREGILPDHLQTALCPITGDALSYEAFRNELLNPTHGKSDFQVGHLNPLKLGADNGKGAGHTAENISWISADGNRIQGSLSLDDVRDLIQRIANNYTSQGWWPKSGAAH